MLSDTEMARRIKAEREKYEADEEVIHNRMLHKRILEPGGWTARRWSSG